MTTSCFKIYNYINSEPHIIQTSLIEHVHMMMYSENPLLNHEDFRSCWHWKSVDLKGTVFPDLSLLEYYFFVPKLLTILSVWSLEILSSLSSKHCPWSKLQYRQGQKRKTSNTAPRVYLDILKLPTGECKPVKILLTEISYPKPSRRLLT